ncbi:MAG TPA: 50S ribosomal protein L6 [archaeon]|jgi:large subunit ribosomal protein L6|nr:50S ribosomal protein L6 [archaeon]HPC10163.1 50S ribosomal protein L6 [archaeon]HRT02346.1 50S ribosomal protein L6 [Candidatus Diapherotrites archaeon]
MEKNNVEKIKNKKLEPIEIIIPSDISVNIFKDKIEFSKSGEVQVVIVNPVYLSVEMKDNILCLIPKNSRKINLSILNTTQKLVKNVLQGYEKGYECKLAIVYSHFPITVKVEGNTILISNFLGEKKPRKARCMPGCKVDVKGKEIIVSGKNKYYVSQTAGNIQKATRVTGKDYRIFDDGCYIVEKTK